MAEVCFKYESPTCLDSCAGHNELRVGEQVILNLSDKNPLWPDSIVADVTAVEFGTVSDGFSRRYTFCYDDVVLNGGPAIDNCDFEGSPRCFSCCDADRFTPQEIPDAAFADPANPTEAEILAWLENNENTGDFLNWFKLGTENAPSWYAEIHSNGPVIKERPTPEDTDTRLTQTSVVSNETETVITWQFIDVLTGDPVGFPFTTIIPKTIDTDTVTTLAQNADGDFEVIVDGTVTGTIPANNVSVTGPDANGNFTVTDSETGNSFLVGCILLIGDVLAGNRWATVPALTAAMYERIKHVEIDADIVDPTVDFFSLSGHRQDNQFYLTNNPNQSWDGAIRVLVVA